MCRDQLMCRMLDVSGSWSSSVSVLEASECLTILPLQAAIVLILFSITHLKLFLQGVGEQSKVYIAILNPLWFFFCLLVGETAKAIITVLTASIRLILPQVPIWHLSESSNFVLLCLQIAPQNKEALIIFQEITTLK